MPDDSIDPSIDIAFSVPFTHRLRVTDDVAGRDFSVLRDALPSGDGGPPRVLVVGESAVAAAASTIAQNLAECGTVRLVSNPLLLNGGEDVKNPTLAAKQVLARINDANLDRRSYIVAIGGGAMLDAVGYAAAVAHRGVRLVRLPTTTLAQADSGVGVKNAINYFNKKNWVGSFAVPWAVINDTKLLTTLSGPRFPERVQRSRQSVIAERPR